MLAMPSSDADARVAAVSAEAVHTVNNALGLLIGAESLFGRDGARASAGPQAEALGCVRAAEALLAHCADALNVLAIREEDLLAAAHPPAELLAGIDRLCAQIPLAVRWESVDLPARDLSVDGDMAQWLASCAVNFVRRGIGRNGELFASARAEGEAFVLRLWCVRPPGASLPRANLSTLALRSQHGLLAQAGIGIVLAEHESEMSVKLSFALLSEPDPE